MVDIQAALKTNTLDGNIYLLDNLKNEGSEGIGTGNLTSSIKGSYWNDGSQTCDIVLNWLITGISTLPVTLPRNYAVLESKNIEKRWLHDIKKGHEENTLKSSAKLGRLFEKLEKTNSIKDKHGNTSKLGFKTLNIFAEPFEDNHHISTLSFLPPIINNITGDAVNNKILFPAQYGTPVQIKDGWYWSATVDTSKIGIHTYTLHLTLYKYDVQNSTWIPIEMKHEAKLKITNEPQVNGFTNAGIGTLPLI